MKNKKWIKTRHKVIRRIFLLPVILYCKLKYGVKVQKFNGEADNYLFISNHQTDGDELFPIIAFKKPTYFLASEDLFSKGFASKLMKYAFAPIPFDKTKTDILSIKKCVSVSREGGSIAVFPEGNRTYSGETGFIKPSIVKFIRLLKLPVAFFVIKGGYGVQPRWAYKSRKGVMKAGVKKVIEKEEYDKMSDDELYDAVCKNLFVNESLPSSLYKSHRKAEFLERALFVCPDCGLSTWHSHKNTATCLNCGKKIEYLNNKQIKCINGTLKYNNFLELYKHQEDYLNNLKLEELKGKLLYSDCTKLYEIIPYKKTTKITNKVFISMYCDKIIMKYKDVSYDIPFTEIDGIAVLGHNKLNVKFNDTLYQFKGDKRFNALKYLNFYHLNKGEKNGKFLGL